MNIVDDSIGLLVFLLPGFVAMKVVAHKCDVKQQTQQETLIDALLYSVVVYMILGVLGLEADLTKPKAILAAFMLAVVVGIIWGEARNREWVATFLGSGRFGISTHDKIFYLKGAEKLFGRWHVIGLKNGKELFGIIRNVDTNTNEMLMEDARWLVGGRLAGEPSWVYLPPETEIEYIRAEGEAASVGHTQEDHSAS
jgi:uncharacterized protein DUF6338